MTKIEKIERAYKHLGGVFPELREGEVVTGEQLLLLCTYSDDYYYFLLGDYYAGGESYDKNMFEYICTKQEFEEYVANRTHSTTSAKNTNNVNLTLETTLGHSNCKLVAENLSQETALAIQAAWANAGKEYPKPEKKRHIAVVAHPQQFEHFIKNLGGRYSQSQRKLITGDTVYYNILPTSKPEQYAGMVLHAVLTLTSVNWVLGNELHTRVHPYEEN